MVRKVARDVRKGDTLLVGGEALTIREVEVSDIGKQGTKKVRLVAQKHSGESVTLIRPEDYPVEVQ